MSARLRRLTVPRSAAVVAVALGVLATVAAPGPQTATEPAASVEAAAGSAADPARQAEDRARQIAQQAGERVEVTSLRQERREVFANPDGSFTAVEYAEPVRTVLDGKWVKVDDSLTQRKDGHWSPKAATVDLRFSGGGDGPFARMRKAGREFALSWPGGPLPEPTVEGNKATYAEVLPGVDLVARAEVDGLGHLLVVKTPEAAQNEALGRIEIGMKTIGLTMAETEGGALLASDAEVGGTVFEAAPPVMWDSAAVAEGEPADGSGTTAQPSGMRPAAFRAEPLDGEVESGDDAEPAGRAALDGPGGGGRTSPVEMEVGADSVTLLPDQQLLKAEDTVFPVVIDPIQKTTSRTAWTSVMSGKPTAKDWKYSGSAGMGRCPTDYNPVSCNGVGTRRLLYTMPMSFYKGKQILGATLSARLNHVYWADAKAEPVQLYRIGGKNYTVTSSSNWSNTKDDWDDYLMTVDRKVSPTSCSSQANLHFEGGELTSEVQAAANGGWSSLSLGLRAKDESRFGEWKRVCGNTYLSVSYNNPPKQVDHKLMSSNPGGTCVWGDGRPYTEKPPVIRAEARDPDHSSSRTDKVKMQFKVDWTDSGGTARSYTADTSYKAPNTGTVFSHTVRSTIPQNTVIYWSARAYDGDAWGEWSHEGSPQRCEFLYDASRPGAPAVTSEQYPDDEVKHDGVGTAGTFTFEPNPDDAVDDGDIVEYRYAFDDETKKTVAATSPGGPASVTWTPMSAGRHSVTVEAFDRAKNSSAPAHYEFLVSDGSPAAGQWNLAEEPEAEDAHDETGNAPATPGPGVEFGVQGPGGTADLAARLDGSSGAYLDAGATVLDTRGSFSVSAWVRPTRLDRDMAVVSQDGSGEPGFVLGYDHTAGSWAFSMPVSDVDTLGHWKASAGVTVLKDQWTLLTGVYDAHASGGPELRIYVNQHVNSTAKRRSLWTSHGTLQIGRTLARSGYRDHFEGDLAEVRALSRVLPAAQVAELMTVKPQRTGYWTLDEVTGGSIANVQPGGQPLALHGDASVYRPADPLFDEAALVGDGHLVLDGDGDHATTATPPIGGDSSFTVAARAQLTSLDPEKSQTVISLPGANADRFAVRYEATSGLWQLAVATEDTAGAKTTSVVDEEQVPDNAGSGHHLAVVYDAFANELRLYVQGQLADTAHVSDDTLWKATGGLQVGRSANDGQHFAGALDEVRTYAGAADPAAVRRMAQLSPDSDM
ncbi:LamG domain-containing protein [Streptomyces sp. NPDC090026]|uniref:LamG domain-containing protein n=1 Tax=Streptomyces sp. NPDC090026 TaxID=3365923 RepID=UPI00380A38D7